MSTELIRTDERHFLERAAQYLENPSFLMRVTAMVGQPLEKFAQAVPEPVKKAVDAALTKTMELAIRTVPGKGGSTEALADMEASSYWSGLWHKLATGATGVAGGYFGLPGLAVELPITTGIMFRSIAAIADDFGEDLSLPETRMEALTLFSYGGPAPQDSGGDSTYLATRLGLAMFVNQSSQFVARASAAEIADLLAKEAAPPLVRFVGQIAARFAPTVAQKALAQAIPSVVGAAGAAFVNVAFTDHFNAVARYHFGIRKLERQYGVEVVQSLYRVEVGRLKDQARPRLGVATRE